MAAAELRRKHGVSSATSSAWRAKHSGLDVLQARKLQALEENTRLKKLLTEAMLDNAVLRDVTARSGEARHVRERPLQRRGTASRNDRSGRETERTVLAECGLSINGPNIPPEPALR